MSLMFKGKGKGGHGIKTPPGGGTRTPPSGGVKGGTIKLVELYGDLAALAAGLSNRIIDYTIPDGHCAELIAVGIMPDYNLGPPAASNLLDTEIGYDNKLTGIKFLTNHFGRNALPFGERLSKNPLRLLDYPSRKGNLTPKYNEGMKVQIVITAGAVAIATTVRARAKVLLYEEADVRSIFGTGISDFATIAGGVSQSLPEVLFAEYSRTDPASAGKGQWENLYEKKVQDFEEIKLAYMGIDPSPNADELKLYDLRLKKEFPEYEPYWKVNAGYNMLPFGDDDDEQPTTKLPTIVADHVYTNTTMRVQVKDLTAVIPQYGMAVQLLGSYKRTR